MFFYKNSFFKNNFYKNYLFFKNLHTKTQVDFTIPTDLQLFNFLNKNNFLKLNSSQFNQPFNDLLTYNDSSVVDDSLETINDIKDNFNNLFFKKTKFIFFKNNVSKPLLNNICLYNTFLSNINNNIVGFEKFFFKKMFKLSTTVIFFSFKSFFFKNTLFLYKFKKSNEFDLFFKKLPLFNNKINKDSFYKGFFFSKTFYSISINSKKFLHPKNKYFSFLKKNNFILDFNFFSKNAGLIKSLIILDKSERFFNDFRFFEDFFFKNFFFTRQSNNASFSTIFYNSYLYNSFFELNRINYNGSILTNYTPHILIDLFLQKKIFSKLTVNFVPNFYRYVYYSVANSLEYLLKKKLFLKIFSKSTSNTTTIEHIDLIFFKNRSIQSRIGRGFFLHEMLDILYTSFFYKDLNFLIKWFVKTMNRISFLNHKKFISSFKQIILNNSDFFIKNNNIDGFFFDIRGKLGVTGDAKKRHFSFYVGDFSKTTKKYKFDYQFDIVRTYTGALGITMYLSYK